MLCVEIYVNVICRKQWKIQRQIQRSTTKTFATKSRPFKKKTYYTDGFKKKNQGLRSTLIKL